MPTLSLRALNRATLARQMLLARERVSVSDALVRLVGLQAQLMRPPALALAARVEGFRVEQLRDAMEHRLAVRATMMRGTLHLMTADDYVAFRSLMQPLLTKLVRREAKIDVAAATRWFANPRTFDSLRDELLASDPSCDARAIAYAARMHLPLIEVSDAAEFVLAERWLGRPVAQETKLHDLVLRYLAAFGPATPADFQNWSGLPAARVIFEDLRPRLVTFRDEKKRELFDLPDAPRPSEDVPAPVRFLPDFDVLLLGHADRTRVIADEHRAKVFTKNLRILPVFLVDGFAAGTWKVEKGKVQIEPFRKLGKREIEEVRRETNAVLRTED